jgi:hypothetical protein
VPRMKRGREEEWETQSETIPWHALRSLAWGDTTTALPAISLSSAFQRQSAPSSSGESYLPSYVPAAALPRLSRAPADRGSLYTTFVTSLTDEPVSDAARRTAGFLESYLLWSALFYSKSAAPVHKFWRSSGGAPQRASEPSVGRGPLRSQEQVYVANTDRGVFLFFSLGTAVPLQAASRWLRGKMGNAVREDEINGYCSRLGPLGDLDLHYLHLLLDMGDIEDENWGCSSGDAGVASAASAQQPSPEKASVQARGLCWVPGSRNLSNLPAFQALFSLCDADERSAITRDPPQSARTDPGAGLPEPAQSSISVTLPCLDDEAEARLPSDYYEDAMDCFQEYHKERPRGVGVRCGRTHGPFSRPEAGVKEEQCTCCAASLAATDFRVTCGACASTVCVPCAAHVVASFIRARTRPLQCLEGLAVGADPSRIAAGIHQRPRELPRELCDRLPGSRTPPARDDPVPYTVSILWSFSPPEPPPLEVVREVHESKRRELIFAALGARTLKEVGALTLADVATSAAALAKSGALPPLRAETCAADRRAHIKRCIDALNEAKQRALSEDTAPAGDAEEEEERRFAREAARHPHPTWQNLRRSKEASAKKSVARVRRLLTAATGSLACSGCDSACEPTRFLDTATLLWKPISLYARQGPGPLSMPAKEVLFCSVKCEELWRSGASCRACGCTETQEVQGAAAPDVRALMSAHHDLREVLLRARALREGNADLDPGAERIAQWRCLRVQGLAGSNAQVRVCKNCAGDMVRRHKACDTRAPILAGSLYA